jgi:hypothetical protein
VDQKVKTKETLLNVRLQTFYPIYMIEAMHIGFSQNRDFFTDDILEAASQIIPLARTAQEQIQFLQDWAAAGKARLASRDSRFGRIQSSLS